MSHASTFVSSPLSPLPLSPALGVQVVEVCVAARSAYGGLVPMDRVLAGIDRKQRGAPSPAPASSSSSPIPPHSPPPAASTSTALTVSEDDIIQAVRQLKVLGGGFSVIRLGSRKYIRALPGDLDRDEEEVMRLADEEVPRSTATSSRGSPDLALPRGCLSVARIENVLRWRGDRTLRVLQRLIHRGLVWIDQPSSSSGGGGGGETLYWFPALEPDLF